QGRNGNHRLALQQDRQVIKQHRHRLLLVSLWVLLQGGIGQQRSLIPISEPKKRQTTLIAVCGVKKKYNKLIYTLIIFPVIKVGKAYASTMVGMMTGLTLILSFSEGISKTIMPLFFIVCISMYWFLFEAILYVSKNGLPSNVSKKNNKYFIANNSNYNTRSVFLHCMK
ncbi:hypothetical protein, partial [Enterobacter hormaechei]|uniref:hypothetical protein n=1 Tax=Enterobacter hormaechei TaxID=158836 RepID=UPI00187D3D32